MIEPLGSLKFESIEHFCITDFNVLQKAIKLDLSALEYRTLQYCHSCIAHEQEIVDIEAIEYLEITLAQFYEAAESLQGRNLLPGEIIFLGENQ